MKISRKMEKWSPLVVLVAFLLLWQAVVVVFGIAEFIFPSPWQIALQFVEFQSALLEAAWKTFWVTMLGFAVSIVVGVMLGFLIGSSRLAYTALYPRRRWCPSWWCGSASASGPASSPRF
jgi:NitT/TauT family transport system permease protein